MKTLKTIAVVATALSINYCNNPRVCVSLNGMVAHLNKTSSIKERTVNRYSVFKEHTKLFKDELDFMKRPEADDNLKAFLLKEMYHKQFQLYEEWLKLDGIQFPETYHLDNYWEYYRHYKPRDI